MSIRLDWEIEAERESLRGGTEDPETRRRRRRAQFGLLLLILLVTVVIGGLVGVVVLRLRYVDWQIEQQLRDTVEAEIAALRIGDQSAFLRMQRSDDPDWLRLQAAEFQAYQALKLEPNTFFPGEIVSVAFDGQTARVQIREIIEGAAYERVWFYWNYQIDTESDGDGEVDGWRHLPPHYPFWGEVQTLEGSAVTISYHDLDAPVAVMARDQIDRWVGTAQEIFGVVLPPITVEIVPDPGLIAGWVGDTWTLRIPSPLTTRMRVDSPFDPAVQLIAADAVGDRMVNTLTHNLSMTYPADAYYLRRAVVSWLTGRLTGRQTNAFLFTSLAQNYGDQAVAAFMLAIQPDSSVRLFADTLGLSSIDQAALDWRDYLTWRLALEGELISRGDENAFLSLYDVNDPMIRQLAATRYLARDGSDGWVVTALTQEVDLAGIPTLRAAVVKNGEESAILFRLSDGVWKRAS